MSETTTSRAEQQLIDAGLLAKEHGLAPEDVEALAAAYAEEIRATMDSATPSIRDVMIEILHGPGVFRMPGEEQTLESFQAVILDVAEQRAWYEKNYQPGQHDPPDCLSKDGIKASRASEMRTVNGEQARVFGECRGCAFAAWGSSRMGGDGKDCAEFRVLALKVRGREFPMILRCPPTSIKPVNAYLVSLANQKRPMSATLTEFSLRKDPPDAIYSVLSMKAVQPLSHKLFLDIKSIKSSATLGNLLDASADTVESQQIEHQQEAAQPQPAAASAPAGNGGGDDEEPF